MFNIYIIFYTRSFLLVGDILGIVDELLIYINRNAILHEGH